ASGQWFRGECRRLHRFLSFRSRRLTSLGRARRPARPEGPADHNLAIIMAFFWQSYGNLHSAWTRFSFGAGATECANDAAGPSLTQRADRHGDYRKAQPRRPEA